MIQFRVAKPGRRTPALCRRVCGPVPRIPESAAVQNRILTLGEKDDKAANPMMMLLNNAHWDMPVTENPALNSVEI